MRRRVNSERRYVYAPNAHNFVHILIHEVLDVEKLSKGIAMLHHLNTVLNSVLYECEHGLELREIPFMMPEIIVLNRDNEKSYKKIMNEEEMIPINLRSNAPYRVIVLRDNEYTDLIVFSHQVMMDAHSTLTLTKAILAAYEGKGYDHFEYDTVNDIQLELSLLEHHFLDQVIKKYRDDKLCMVEEEYRHNYREYYKTYRTKYVEIIFDEDETKAIKNYANVHNLNLYTTIFTAFKAAESKVQGNRDKNFKQSVILKSLRSSDDEFGNFATLGFIYFEYNPHKSLEFNTKVIQKILDTTDYNSYYYLNKVIPMSAFRALEEKKDVIFDLDYYAHRLGYWDYQIGSELSFCDEIEFDSCLPIENIQVLRGTHQLVEKNVSVVESAKKLYVTLQYNSKSANRKDLHEIIQTMAELLLENAK